MTTKDTKEARYTQNMKDQGYVRCHPWVWPKDREAVLEYARKLREGIKTPLEDDPKEA